MRLTKLMLVTALAFCQMTGGLFAAWTLNNVSDVTPGGTIACSDSAVVSSSYTVTISYKLNLTVTDLTSKGGTTHYMQTNWAEDFDPALDYDPPGAWPITGGDGTKIMQAKLTSGGSSEIKFFECNTAP